MTSKVVRFEVEGQRRVGLIQKQVDAGHLDAVPFKDRTQNLPGGTHHQFIPSTTPSSRLVPLRFGVLSPEGFLLHRRDDFSVDVHVEVKLEGEALLTGVLKEGLEVKTCFHLNLLPGS